MKTLFDEMRSEQNLFAAWRHVKKSALNSSNPEIRGQAAEFEHSHQTHLHTIGRQLRERRFKFAPVTGVLKDKKKRAAAGKAPRPIAVAPLTNRIVQRAILQVLQPRMALDHQNVDTKYRSITDERLGNINEINRSKYGVGGLLKPYGGVRPAIESVMAAMRDGAEYFFQSDIQAFFTQIPTPSVIGFVRQETKDDPLADIFAAGLELELANSGELSTYANLFPADGKGVAQGSSLSAFAGNVLLYDLDHQLNTYDVTAVRYIDDLLIVSPSKDDLNKAKGIAQQKLADFGFSLHDPKPGSDKAAEGKCANSFTFLGCTIQPNRCVPSATAIKKLQNDVADTLSKSKRAIDTTIRTGKPLDHRQSKSATLQSIGGKLFGWQRSFSFCTDRQVFQQVDANLTAKIEDYEHWFLRKTKNASAATKAELLGIPSCERLFLGDQKNIAR